MTVGGTASADTSGGHLSPLTFDRLLADETAGLAAARAHLQACSSCNERFEALREEQLGHFADASAVAARVSAIVDVAEATPSPVGRLFQRLRSALGRGWGLRIAAPVGALVAATALLVTIWPVDQPDRRGRAGELRLKGDGVSFRILRADSGGHTVVAAQDQVAPGVPLSFQLRCPAGCQVILAAAGETGDPSVVEHQAAAPWSLPPSGEPATLPVGASLDEEPGGERFFALVCAKRPSRAGVLKAIAEAYPLGQQGRRDLSREVSLQLADCRVLSQWVGASRGADDR